GVGIDVVKANGTYQFDLAFDDFAPPVAGLSDPAHQNALVWNDTTGQYALVPASVFIGGGTSPATAIPLVESGAGAVGVAVKYAREDHIHPAFSGGGTPSNANPVMDGVAAPGVATPYSRADHVHPSDTSRAAVAHNHVAADVTDFSEAVDDRVGSLLVAGANIALDYQDAAGTLTITSTAAGGGGGDVTGPVSAV